MIDPTHLTALHSLDLGDVMSPDGRAHPFTALIPAVPVPVTLIAPGSDNGAVRSSEGQELTPASRVAPAGSGGAAGAIASGLAASATSSASDWLTDHLPKHFGVRAVVVVVALGVILLVVWRLIKS